jgi:heme/copper-type cytochrome/quinol oxidase subunit 2
MTFYFVAAAVVVVGVAIGWGAMVAARRSADDPEQAVHRQRIIQRVALVIIAALLIFDAVDTPKHRYVNLVLVALMAGGIAYDWFKARKASAAK